ncbi:heterokaryon incompatibility protein-domain-containing protein [Thermothelomyces heterothallicus CBS 202.75]|uniref:heterokaryon incompatibility protein-domain-containing protein n=1 Tax=Thermothelomyces heterothallicus CBS 202.75 TaxID=1149848 RepID=UPI0037420550
MRLLNATTFEVEEFHGSEIPQYAILSHTWGAEEVTLQEVEAFARYRRSRREHARHMQKAGFSKIDYACRQAIKDGYRYVWVDTCCIDKRSSAEVSEAVNSMFDWYQRAAVCYAYLEDVHFDDYTEGYRTWKDHFHGSRWFTRGWTLQELLAPKKVVFYARGWRLLGTKSSLVKHVVKATGIDEVTLIDPELIYNASVAQRMSWAANRTTTRIEDQAYSLLGIFGVNMPIIYGEGTKAFLRLQEEIIKRSDDHSIFAWGTLGHPSSHHHHHHHHHHLAGPSDDELDYAAMTGTTGVLATSPRDFAGMEHVITTAPPPNRDTSDYAMTNKGLRITLDMTRQRGAEDDTTTTTITTTTTNTHLAILNCRPDDDPSVRLALLLTETATPNVLLRTRTRTATLVSAADASAAGPRSVYILNAPAQAPHSAAKLAEEVVLVRTPDLIAPGYDVLDVRGCGAQWNREFRSIRLVGVDYTARRARRGGGGGGGGLFQLAVVTFWNKHLKCGFLARILVEGASKVAFVDLVQGLRSDGGGGDGNGLVEEAKRIWEQPGTVQVSVPGRGGDTPGRRIQVEVVNPVAAPEAAGNEEETADERSGMTMPGGGWTFRPGHELQVSGSVTFTEKWEKDYRRTVNAKAGRTKKGAIELTMTSMLWLAVPVAKGEELDQPS